MNLYLIIILIIILGNYLLDIVVDILNVRHVTTDLPKEFEGFYDAEKYTKSQQYLKETTRFGIMIDTFITPITIIFILIGGLTLDMRLPPWIPKSENTSDRQISYNWYDLINSFAVVPGVPGARINTDKTLYNR